MVQKKSGSNTQSIIMTIVCGPFGHSRKSKTRVHCKHGSGETSRSFRTARAGLASVRLSGEIVRGRVAMTLTSARVVGSPNSFDRWASNSTLFNYAIVMVPGAGQTTISSMVGAAFLVFVGIVKRT